MQELNDDETLAVMKLLAKLAKDKVSETEGAYRDEVVRVYEDTGMDRYTLKSQSGAKLGTVSVSGGDLRVEVQPGCDSAWKEAMLDAGHATMVEVPAHYEITVDADWRDSMAVIPETGSVMFRDTGEIADWAIAMPTRLTTRVTLAKQDTIVKAIGAERLGLGAASLLLPKEA